MAKLIFSIITLVFSVTWSYWFSAQDQSDFYQCWKQLCRVFHILNLLCVVVVIYCQ